MSGANGVTGARPARVTAAALAVGLAVALAGGLGACGKRGDLERPEGEAAAYTWPRVYPDPATVRPEAEAETENGQVPSRQQAPAHASDITSFPETQ